MSVVKRGEGGVRTLNSLYGPGTGPVMGSRPAGVWREVKRFRKGQRRQPRVVGLQNVREDVLMAIRCSGLMVRQVGREDALWLGWGSRI